MQPDIIYRINDRDEIVHVNEEWDRFAGANEGETSLSSRVLNRPLWEFISEPTTRQLYRQLVERVRAGDTMRFRFRCDSATWRRLLQMEIMTRNEGLVEFRSQTLMVTPRKTPVPLNTGSESTVELLTVCSWCKNILTGDFWMDPDEAIDKLKLFATPSPPMITHGICQTCEARMREMLSAS